jgi:hypothetical protein
LVVRHPVIERWVFEVSAVGAVAVDGRVASELERAHLQPERI